jgi:hypothetical protein
VKAKVTIETEDGQTIGWELADLYVSESRDVQVHYFGPGGPPIETVAGPMKVTITGLDISRRGIG